MNGPQASMVFTCLSMSMHSMYWVNPVCTNILSYWVNPVCTNIILSY